MEVLNKNLPLQVQATNESLTQAGISPVSLETINFENIGLAMAAIAARHKMLDKALNQLSKLKEEYAIELEYWRDKVEEQDREKVQDLGI